MVAVAAVGAGGGDAFAFGETGDYDVEEAAEGQAEEGGEDCADGLDFVGDGIWAPVLMGMTVQMRRLLSLFLGGLALRVSGLAS